ncbi:hypothetical protein SEPCBS57363_000793 [Sporothrix epigloea]|uniref:Uncharacterized protein n=1 Tax=Sporothrix epigloea TaxID=1892477 RepID=A0ABP0D6P8_9PEZI
MPYRRPLDYVRHMSHLFSHSCRRHCCFGLRPPFPHCVVVAQTLAAVLVGIILFGPLFIQLYCGDKHESLLLEFLGLILFVLGVGVDSNNSCAISTWPVAWVANYAYLFGFLFSLGDPFGMGELRPNNHTYRYLLSKRTNGSEPIGSGRIAFAVVGLAFDSGRAQSLTWPFADSIEKTRTIAVLRKDAFGSALFQRVYPLTVVTIVLPILVSLFYITTKGLLHRLSCSTPGTFKLRWPLSKDTSGTHAKPKSSESPSVAKSHRHTPVSSEIVPLPGSTILTTKALFRGTGPAGTKPPSPLRVSGRVLVGVLRVVLSTVAEGAVETLAPFVFGAILIVTLATALVMYGIGHVGVASLTESGVFGLTKDAIDTLLGLVRLQWRFVRQLRWSWWLDTAARYERRYEDQVLGAGNAHHDIIVQESACPVHYFCGHDVHVCSNAIRTDCLLHWPRRSTNEPVDSAISYHNVNDGGLEARVRNVEQHDEEQAESAEKRRHSCQIHHHHHHHHHHRHRLRPRLRHRHRRSHSHERRQSQAGSHIRLEKRRDWVRWFFGLPRMTTVDDPQWAGASLTSAAAEVARDLFRQQVVMQPGTDGLVSIDDGAEDDAEQGRQRNAWSSSLMHDFTDDSEHTRSNNSQNMHPQVEMAILPYEAASPSCSPESKPAKLSLDASSGADSSRSSIGNCNW